MRDKLKRIVLVSAGVAALTGGTIAVTDTAAAKPKHKHAKKHKASKKRSANRPAALTGDTKTQAEAAALAAVPGGEVEKSFAARAGNPDNAAYVVIVEKDDDSYVVRTHGPKCGKAITWARGFIARHRTPSGYTCRAYGAAVPAQCVRKGHKNTYFSATK